MIDSDYFRVPDQKMRRNFIGAFVFGQLILAEAPSGNAEIDAEVDRMRTELEGIDTEIGRLADALRQHGPSPAISEFTDCP